MLLYGLFTIFSFCVCDCRYLKNELRHMRVVCAEHTDGTQCPACPKVWTKYCMCAYLLMHVVYNAYFYRVEVHLFWQLMVTLVCTRKKSAGKIIRPPLHDGVYFESQEKVDSFVSNYTVGKAVAVKVRTLLYNVCNIMKDY